MVGNAERINEKIQVLQRNESAILIKITEFLRNHILYKSLLVEKGMTFSLSVDEFRQHLRSVYSSTSLTDTSLNQYGNAILSWFRSVGLIEIKGSNIVNVSETSAGIVPRLNLPRMRKRQLSHFLGDAPAHRVLDVMKLIQQGAKHEETLTKRGYRNAIAVLFSLDALAKEKGELELIIKTDDYHNWLADKVSKTETIKYIISMVKGTMKPNSIEIGKAVSKYLNKNWSEASSKRYGAGLISWVQWMNEGRALTLF